MSQTIIRRALPADADTVAQLWEDAAAWLALSGTDQWQYPVRRNAIGDAIDTGTCWIIHAPSSEQIGTVTLDTNADKRLWAQSDEPETALYLHRLVLAQQARGDDLGSAVLDWASLTTQAAAKRWLRLDAWTTNTKLHHYYLTHGFEHVRTIDDAGIVSGALFQRAAGLTLNRGLALVVADAAELTS